ncbi:hypothetical protein AVEN_233974-1 [Araneus ventricosus]|uniref:Uncharacterized protein n=1 Tax=Araneus ventricosus TaxID=182803 RepID=A0A4Y2NSL9_ARAVE|nr:hypothetical protein AVEN_233974-1 [Araneus ventricosus]
MVSSSYMTIPTPLAILKNCCKSSSKKSGATPPYGADLAPNLSSIYLSGARFSSESDVKTAAESWLNGQGRDFCEDWLNKLVLRSDKCLNNHVEK